MEFNGTFVETAADSRLFRYGWPVGFDPEKPVADNQQVSTPQDTDLDIILTGTDPHGKPLTYSIEADPSAYVGTWRNGGSAALGSTLLRRRG